MTIIEIVVVPVFLAGVIFVIALPFVGPKAAWDLAASGTIILSSLAFGFLRVSRIFGRPPRCACGHEMAEAVFGSALGSYWKCPVCDSEYWVSTIRTDGWLHCARLLSGNQLHNWKKRRRFGRWIDDNDSEPMDRVQVLAELVRL